jgi:hypothetical protein
LSKRADFKLFFLIILCRIHQDADPPHPFGLLRARRERPCSCRATEQRDELASPHTGSQGQATALYRLKRVL